MKKARIAGAAAAVAMATAGMLGGAVPASAGASVAGDYYCSSGPNTTDNGTRAEATCQSFGPQVRIAADCDWSPWNIYSNAFNTNLEYRKTNGSCWYGVISAWIDWA